MTLINRIKNGSEGTFQFNGEIYNFRAYNDGVVKLETLNSLDFFDSIQDFKSALVGKTLTNIELF